MSELLTNEFDDDLSGDLKLGGEMAWDIDGFGLSHEADFDVAETIEAAIAEKDDGEFVDSFYEEDLAPEMMAALVQQAMSEAFKETKNLGVVIKGRSKRRRA